MRTPLLKAALVGGAAAAALAIGAGSASAAATYTVSAGSAAAGATVAITGTTTGASPQVLFVDKTSGTKLNCASATAPGTTKVGAGRAAAGLGTINGAGTKWTGCTGPLGLVLNVTGIGTWKINGTGATATGIKGSITAVQATVADTGGQCSFKVTGYVPGTFVNSNSTLVLPGTTAGLSVSNVVGCFGLVNSGDKATFKATYALKATKAAFNPITITSP